MPAVRDYMSAVLRPLRSTRAIIVLGLMVSAVCHASPAPKQFKLLFANAQDVTNTWGKLCLGATPMQKIRACKDPGFILACCLPREKGEWEVYGQSYKLDEAGQQYEKRRREVAIWLERFTSRAAPMARR